MESETTCNDIDVYDTNLNEISENVETRIRLITGKDRNKPSSKFDGVIGQQSAIERIRFFIASQSLKKPFPTMLFKGGHGLGKTYVSNKLAKNLQRKFIELNAESTQSDKFFVEEILINRVLGQETVTMLIDEAHRLPQSVTALLLTMLSPVRNNINVLRFNKYNIEYDLSKINVILATTDHYKMAPALINRCAVIPFLIYNNNELEKMLAMYMPSIQINCDKEDLAFACRGRGRDAYVLANNILRYCSMNNISYLDDTGWEYIKRVFGIYPMGLNSQEVSLLKIIEKEVNISSNNLATKLSVEEEVITQDIEIRPRELGLITNTSKGRSLTQEGKEYCKNISSID